MITTKESRFKVGTGHIFVRHLIHDTSQDCNTTLVFLHEALGSVALWRDFPDSIARITGLNAIVYDRPGYGGSDPSTADWSFDYLHREAEVILPELLTALGISKAILVGHSDGGSIALIYAARFPGNVAGVVAEAAHVYVDPVALAGIHKTIKTYETTNLREKLSKYHGNKTDRVFTNWHRTWTSKWFKEWDIKSSLRNISCPVLTIQGIDDEYSARDQVEFIRDGVSGVSESLLIPECRHVPHAQAREATIKGITTFIDRYILQNQFEDK